MDKEFFFRPDYVEKFKCDGQKCNAICCKKSWVIDIDKKTYKSYEKLRPKAAAKEITSHINFIDQIGKYVIVPDEKGVCPLLGEDNLCTIQKKYGEDYLSVTCQTYPRNVLKIGDVYEVSLSITCPVAAELILLQKEPIRFEEAEMRTPGAGKVMFRNVRLENGLTPEHIFTIQKAAISILQERRLTIDQRLAVLGFFLDKLDELMNAGKVEEISGLAEFYTSEKFFSEQVPEILSAVHFDVSQFVKIMMAILESLYGKDSSFGERDNFYVEKFTEVFQIVAGENGAVSIFDVAKNYMSLNDSRKSFVNIFSTIFENYLVNEFFYNFYPWRLNVSIQKNFAVFLATYKIIEIFTFSVTALKFNKSEDVFTGLAARYKLNMGTIISNLALHIDHNSDYLKAIEKNFENNNDTLKIMSAFLQTD